MRVCMYVYVLTCIVHACTRACKGQGGAMHFEAANDKTKLVAMRSRELVALLSLCWGHRFVLLLLRGTLSERDTLWEGHSLWHCLTLWHSLRGTLSVMSAIHSWLEMSYASSNDMQRKYGQSDRNPLTAELSGQRGNVLCSLYANLCCSRYVIKEAEGEHESAFH